jgi:UDP-N-acetylenolpyruvoylglucosamine reductase
LVTNAKATQEEVLNFAENIKDKVFEVFNISLEIEPTIILN